MSVYYSTIAELVHSLMMFALHLKEVQLQKARNWFSTTQKDAKSSNNKCEWWLDFDYLVIETRVHLLWPLRNAIGLLVTCFEIDAI